MCVVVSCQGQQLTTAMLCALDGTAFAFGLMFGNVFYKVLHLATKIVICASCFALVKQQDALFFSDWLFYHPSFPYMGINCETDHLWATPYLVLWELRKLHLRSQ